MYTLLRRWRIEKDVDFRKELGTDFTPKSIKARKIYEANIDKPVQTRHTREETLVANMGRLCIALCRRRARIPVYIYKPPNPDSRARELVVTGPVQSKSSDRTIHNYRLLPRMRQQFKQTKMDSLMPTNLELASWVGI